MTLLPPKINVPATPALEGIDIHTLYDVNHGKLLGKGGFSEVLAVRHVPTGEIRALKVMERSILVGKKGEMVAHEKEILRRTCHPSIITLYEAVQTPDKVYFALDLMNEDLFEFIVRNKKVNEDLTRSIMHQLMSGIAYLHEQSIVHRDIKPENILLDHNQNIKLADFGWSVHDPLNRRKTSCGTPEYFPPEIVSRQTYDCSADLWCLGIFCFELLVGHTPFVAKDNDQIYKKIHAMQYTVPDTVPPEAKDLISNLLVREGAKRMALHRVLNHPFLMKYYYTPNNLTPPTGKRPRN